MTVDFRRGLSAAPHRKISVAATAALLTALALGGPAGAATTTGSLSVTATVQATCTQTITPLAFGIYTGLVLPNTATITVTCTNTTKYNIGLGAGTGAGATVTNRAMTAAGATLKYVLTSDVAHAVNWGDTVATDTVALTATTTPIATTIYGQIAAGQFVAPGAYTDTVVATVTF